MTDAPLWLPVMVLFALLGLAYLGMWRGWRRRAHRHDLPPLTEVPPDPAAALLETDAQFYGTTVSGFWLDRVVARGLGSRSRCRLVLSADGLDVHRPSASFRIPTPELRGARHDQGIAGKVVPPHGVLVVTWQHGDDTLDSGFRLAGPREHDAWVQTITRMARSAPVEGENA
jgi:hypothetical protein